MFDVETKLGTIQFSPNVINHIVTEAVESCDGKVEVLNYKRRYKRERDKKTAAKEERDGIQVRDEDGLVITVCIVIHFGTSIKKTTEKIIDQIYENVEKLMGVKPRTVRIIVTGILSKNIVKRHIEVSR